MFVHLGNPFFSIPSTYRRSKLKMSSIRTFSTTRSPRSNVLSTRQPKVLIALPFCCKLSGHKILFLRIWQNVLILQRTRHRVMAGKRFSYGLFIIRYFSVRLKDEHHYGRCPCYLWFYHNMQWMLLHNHSKLSGMFSPLISEVATGAGRINYLSEQRTLFASFVPASGRNPCHFGFPSYL